MERDLKYYLLILLCLSTSVWAQEVVYFVNLASRPLQVYESKQKLMQSGIVTEIVKEVFKNSKYNLKPVILPTKMKDKKSFYGKYDLWVTYSSPDWEDARDVEYKDFISVPLFPMRQVLVSPKEHNFNYHSVKDLYDKNVIIIEGYDYPGLDRYFKNNIKSSSKYINTYRPKDNKSALKMLERKRGIGFVDGEFRAKYNMRRLGLNVDNYNFFPLDDVMHVPMIHLIVSRGFTSKQKGFIERRLREMKAAGIIDKILSKY